MALNNKVHFADEESFFGGQQDKPKIAKVK
jgi:hypothetical protein